MSLWVCGVFVRVRVLLSLWVAVFVMFKCVYVLVCLCNCVLVSLWVCEFLFACVC